MNQKSKILDYLKEHGSITSWEAYQELKITRLAARIHELKQAGYGITTLMREQGFTRYAVYYLEGRNG